MQNSTFSPWQQQQQLTDLEYGVGLIKLLQLKNKLLNQQISGQQILKPALPTATVISVRQINIICHLINQNYSEDLVSHSRKILTVRWQKLNRCITWINDLPVLNEFTPLTNFRRQVEMITVAAQFERIHHSLSTFNTIVHENADSHFSSYFTHKNRKSVCFAFAELLMVRKICDKMTLFYLIIKNKIWLNYHHHHHQKNF